MTHANGMRSICFGVVSILLVSTVLVTVCTGGEKRPARRNLREPVFRIANRASVPQERPAAAPPAAVRTTDKHPLDRALDMAAQALTRIEQDIRDYTCTLEKQERVNGTLLDPEYMQMKIRNRRVDGNRVVVPFSVYMKFIKPTSVKGREVIYVERRNSGKMVAHEGGVRGKFLPTVWLSPEGTLAMRNQRYPITEIGIATLTQRLIERGQRDRKFPDCKVSYFKNASLNGRKCTVLQVQHAKPRPDLDFYLARIFIDDELGVPVRYEAYDWPTANVSQPQLIEKYTYLNMKLNVGLTDADFNHENSSYNF